MRCAPRAAVYAVFDFRRRRLLPLRLPPRCRFDAATRRRRYADAIDVSAAYDD